MIKEKVMRHRGGQAELLRMRQEESFNRRGIRCNRIESRVPRRVEPGPQAKSEERPVLKIHFNMSKAMQLALFIMTSTGLTLHMPIMTIEYPSGHLLRQKNGVPVPHQKEQQTIQMQELRN